MFAQEFEYSQPKTLAEALTLLADGSAKALAGGQSLIPMMKLRLAAPEHLVDLGRVADLNYIREEGGKLHIGAMVTHYQVESSPLIAQKCPLLAKAAGKIGDVQVRNLGTLGGSVVHADPAADWPASLLALESEVKVQSATGSRTLALGDFFIDMFTTALEPGELLTEIIVPVQETGEGSAYEKVVQPASGFALVGVAVRIVKSGGKVTKARVAVTGLSNCAYRAKGVEDKLLAGASAADAAAVVADGIDANSDIHASADYRKHLARVHTKRALASAGA